MGLFSLHLIKSFPDNTMKRLLQTLLLSVFVFGCDTNEPGADSSFKIFLEFWNTTGRTPEIRFDEMKTSKEIKIDFSQTFEGQTEGNQLTKVVIDNFKIVDNQNNNYNIKGIKAYEYRNNDWKEDVEFTMDFTQTQDVGVVVLVLDRSESLGNDFSRIKEYAMDFVDQTFSSHPEVQMGIVDFSTDVHTFPITNDRTALKEYISHLASDRFTALYEAMDEGVEMLLKNSAQSRILVTFTDGTDNMSDQNYYNLDNILNKIKNDKNTNKIRGFFIGLSGKGGLDNAIPPKLMSNGWIVSIPKSTSEVKEVFEKFGKLISNVYHLTYIRNQQVIPRTTPVKLRFDIQTMP